MSQEPEIAIESTIAHMGVGAFHRAHQAWYTHRASTPADPWDIVAFTGRSPEQARALQEAGCRYTLITRGAETDEHMVIDSIRAAHDGSERGAWEATVSDPRTHVITLTITEAGYRVDARDRLDLADAAVAADLRTAVSGSDAAITTAPVRLALGLASRRRSDAGPLTVISCDNLPRNGAIIRGAVLTAAMQIDPTLADWIDANVAFLSSMVDRITPRTRREDVDELERRTGVRDEAMVITEPFSEWIVEHGFAGSSPGWQRVGVQSAPDLAPYEQRKLRLLNGAHSLLAHRGLPAEYEFVADAFADPMLRDELEAYWRTAVASCTLPRGELDAAVEATRRRFANPRIRHSLAQIALDGRHKLRHRIVPVLEHAVRSGAPVTASAAPVAAWLIQSGSPSHALTEMLSGVSDAVTAKAMRTAIEREIRRLGDTSAGAALRGDAVRS